jgi:hypothetical protein
MDLVWFPPPGREREEVPATGIELDYARCERVLKPGRPL